MNSSFAKFVAQSRGVDYRAIRRAHRASWTWTNGERTTETGRLIFYPAPWGMSVKGTGFDVDCLCGWQSRTGGAIYARVAEAHADHIIDAIYAAAEMKGAN